MTQRRIKIYYFALAGLNTCATTWFFNYLLFFLRDHFGFDNLRNLWTSAIYGFIYIFAAWQCGRFAQRRGYFLSLKIGFGGLAALMGVAAFLNSAPGIIAVLAGYSVVLLFTWPALEALVSANENRSGVQHMVGIYNCTWASAAAIAQFTGGTLYDWNHRAIFWVPGIFFAVQFLIVVILERFRKTGVPNQPKTEIDPAPHPEPVALRQPVRPETFLQMARLSSPFAYVAINTLFAVMPAIAHTFGLSPSHAGLFSSVWFFARLGTFALLWQWNGWHYRFRWLITAFIALIGSFMIILISAQLWMVVLAQLFFGLATGLIYYSSLFYSMDVGGESQAEHGGLHEAAIGAGVFAGPAVGAAALQFLPRHSSSGVLAVTVLLLFGLTGLIALRLKKT
jgi:MFS family permease